AKYVTMRGTLGAMTQSGLRQRRPRSSLISKPAPGPAPLTPSTTERGMVTLLAPSRLLPRPPLQLLDAAHQPLTDADRQQHGQPRDQQSFHGSIPRRLASMRTDNLAHPTRTECRVEQELPVSRFFHAVATEQFTAGLLEAGQRKRGGSLSGKSSRGGTRR